MMRPSPPSSSAVSSGGTERAASRISISSAGPSSGGWLLAGGRSGVGAGEDVGVAVGGAGCVGELGRGLVVAQVHAEPEGDPVLEVEGATGPILGRQGRWVLGQDQPVAVAVPRPGRVGVVEHRRLVM